MLKMKGRSYQVAKRPRSRWWALLWLIPILIILGALAGGGYVGYKLYNSIKNEPPMTATYRETGSGETDEKYFGPVNIEVVDIPQKITRGEKSKLAIKAGAGTTCSIKVADSESQSSRGLYTKRADKKGNLSWDWDVRRSARLGNWPIEITCNNPQHSADLKRTITVVEPESTK